MKNLLNLGKALSKAEQKSINGGLYPCDQNNHCPGEHVWCCYQGACRLIESVVCDAEIP